MQNFVHSFIWLLVILVLAGVGYWGWQSLDDATEVTYNRNLITDDPVDNIVGIPDSSELETEDLPEFLESPVSGELVPVNSTGEIPAEYADLAAGLQDLIDNNINMKVGSAGTRVGVVQAFLNIYLEAQSAADNAYGPGTKARVAEFQSAVGLSSDGLAGMKTYEKMLEWLAEQ